MKQNLFRYLFLSLSLVVFGLTLTWLITHFQQPNLRKVSLDKDYEEIIVQRQNYNQEKIENLNADFDVRDGEIVYIRYRKGVKINSIIKEGKVSIINESDEVVFEYNLLDEMVNRQINLPAGKYRIVEESVPDEEAILNVELSKEKKERKEEDDLKYYIQIWRF